MRAILIFTCLLTFNMAKTQTNDKNTFNFWLGSWDAYWSDSLKGTNTITKTLKENVVEENFKYNDGTFVGRSWSVFDAKKNTWKQTWVDDAGAYLAFTGGKEGDKVVLNLTDKLEKEGKQVSMRMVFFNITKDSFDWDWQSSADGKAWKSSWFIHYKRKAS